MQATIVVVPRERFSYAERSLASVLSTTTEPFKLIYVDAGTPESVRRGLHQQSDRKGFRFLSTPDYVSPNKARNMGWQAVDTKYTVFLDNDALVTPGWLEALVRCAEETGAWVVGPLYLIGELEKRTIHLAGGRLHTKEKQGNRVLYDEQYLFNTPLDVVPMQLTRKQWDYAEFHCMLVRTNLLDSIGPFDDRLLSLQEHIDFCMTVQKAGGSVFLDPLAVTSYVPPPPGDWRDLPYYMLRWSEAWNVASVRHFNEKWGYHGLGWLGDTGRGGDEDTIVRFGRGHRRLLTGLRTNGDQLRAASPSPLEEAELMVALLLSVDRDRFNLSLVDPQARTLESTADLGPERSFEFLRRFFKQAGDKLTVQIEPQAARLSSDPALMRVQGLDSEGVKKLRSLALLALETKPDVFESWIAVDRANWRSAEKLRTLIDNAKQNGPFTIAGSVDRQHRVRIVEGTAGTLVGAHQLDRAELRPYLVTSHVY